MRNEVKDFIMFKAGKKRAYGYIESILPTSIIVKDAEDPTVVHTLEGDHLILSNYGQNPDLDELKIKVHRNDFVKPFFGKVTEYRDVTVQDRKELEKALDEVAASDASNTALYPLSVDIEFAKGKASLGTVKTNAKLQSTRITLNPECFDKNNLKEVLYHNIGLAVWNQKMPNKYKEKWIKFYNKNLSRKKVAETTIKQIRLDFIHSNQTVSEYMKSLGEEEKIIFERIIKTIQQEHNLLPRHLDILIQSQNDLASVWPEFSINIISEYNAFVTERAKESVEMFFAQSYMAKMMGFGNVPSSIDNALHKTLLSVA